MIPGAGAVDSPKNVEAEPGHETCADDFGNVMEEEIPASSLAEKEEGRTKGHSWQWRQMSSKESPIKEEPRSESSQMKSQCRDGKEMLSEEKDKYSNGSSREKHRAWSNSALEKHSGQGKNASSRDHESSESREKPHWDTLKERERRTETRR